MAIPDEDEFQIRITIKGSELRTLEHLLNDNLLPKIKGYLHNVISAEIISLHDEALDAWGDAFDQDRWE